jgi:Ca-activated chloride channel family protein
MSSPTLTIKPRWSQTLVRDLGGEVDLLIRITAPDQPATSRNERTPLDVAFIIDRSGSMGGGKLDAAKAGVRVAAERLDARDRAAVVTFDHEVHVLQALTSAGPGMRQHLEHLLTFVSPGGSTNLGDGWLTGCQQIAMGAEPNGSRRLRRAILLTDGQANIGIVDPDQLAMHAGHLRARGVSTTTLGFGNGFDEQLLSAMAEAGGGNFEFIRSPEQLVPFFTRELGDLLNAAATGLTVHITLPPGVRGELISLLPHERHGKTFVVTVGDVPAGETVDMLLHLTTGRGAIGDQLPVSISAEWNDARTDRNERWSGGPIPVTRATAAAADAAKRDPDVAEKAALVRAARAQREALRLDRAGRHEESRARMRQGADLLAQAPQTERIMQEAHFAESLANAPINQMYEERVHKQTTSRVSRLGRGRSDRAENLSDT